MYAFHFINVSDVYTVNIEKTLILGFLATDNEDKITLSYSYNSNDQATSHGDNADDHLAATVTGEQSLIKTVKCYINFTFNEKFSHKLKLSLKILHYYII